MRILTLVSALALVAGLAVADVPSTRIDPAFDGKLATEIDRDGSDGCPPDVFITPLPYQDAGDSCNGTDTLSSYGGSCSLPFAYAGEDMIYEITLAAGNNVTFSADLTGSNGDLALFLISACGDGASCVVNSQDSIGPGVGPELIDPAAYDPGTYYLYVDSYYGAGTAGSCGTYTLDVTGTIPVELMSFTAE